MRPLFRDARLTRLVAATASIIFVYILLGHSLLDAGPYLGSAVDPDLSPERFAQKDPLSQSSTGDAVPVPKPDEQPLAGELPGEDVKEEDPYHDELKDLRLSDNPPPPPSLSPDHSAPQAQPTPQSQPASDPSPPPPPPFPVASNTASVPASAPDSEPDEKLPPCEDFPNWIRTRHEPFSEGKRQFPFVRPPPHCRTFTLPALEALIEDVKAEIADPDLARLFENAYPMTLDTMVRWRGYANETDPETGKPRRTDQELTYVVTGDIDAMWLRDSASQIYSYLPLLEASSDPDSLASLWRGLINAHARYIIISPYCHSFQPPPESGVPPTTNGAYHQNRPMPPYDPIKVFDCKWELDSLASFLQISVAYYEKTGDLEFFQKYQWIEAVDAAVRAAGAMRRGTYADDGKVQSSAWTFTGWTNRGSETLTNDGLGNPSKENGMIRTAFRPSDDATIFQFLVPANMMFAAYLDSAAEIMGALDGDLAQNVTVEMRDMSLGIRHGIDENAIVDRPGFGEIFAYETDGFGSVNLMDDANVPSLLAFPLWNLTSPSRDYVEIYRNTRRFVLSEANPYYMRGPVLTAVGGPHIGPGKAWPMAAIIAAMTAMEPVTGLEDAGMDKEVGEQISMLLDSTTKSGVLHESVNSWHEAGYTRAWFGWPNGMFGELVLKMREYQITNPTQDWLGRPWQ